MKKIAGILLSILLIVNLAACTAKPKTEEVVQTNTGTNPVLSVEEQETRAAEELHLYFNDLYQQGSFSGSVLVANNGHVIFKGLYGKADYAKNIEMTPKTKFSLQSLTKQFTAAAILQLEDKGLLSVNDKIGKYLPEFEHGDKITIHHLLNHTSGLPGETGNFPWSEFKPSIRKELKEFKSKEEHLILLSDPGTDFQYASGGLGYALLGFIVEAVSGQSIDVYLQENVFEPLGMSNTGFQNDKRYIENQATGYIDSKDSPVNLAEYTTTYLVNGTGGLYSTSEDLYKWSVGLNSGKVLSEAAMKKMFKPNFADYGYGLYVFENPDGSKVCSHPGYGNGFNTQIIMVGTDVCIVILSNFQEIYMDEITEMLKTVL